MPAEYKDYESPEQLVVASKWLWYKKPMCVSHLAFIFQTADQQGNFNSQLCAGLRAADKDGRSRGNEQGQGGFRLVRLFPILS